MKILEAYSPSQIRACGAMLEALKGKRSPEDLIELARILRNPKRQNAITRYRLLLPRVMDRELTSREFLLSLGWEALKSWRRLEQELSRREITSRDLKLFIHGERQKHLNESRYGWKHG